MPQFSHEKSVFTNVDIDPEEYINSCSSNEIDEIIEILIEDGHINKNSRNGVYDMHSVPELEFQDAIQKLNGKWNMLTAEEEQVIVQIASRF